MIKIIIYMVVRFYHRAHDEVARSSRVIPTKFHKYPERNKLDKIRDEYLTNLGYIVYRIEWNRMTGNPEESELTKQK